jgi:hypothetical protein
MREMVFVIIICVQTSVIIWLCFERDRMFRYLREQNFVLQGLLKAVEMIDDRTER